MREPFSTLFIGAIGVVGSLTLPEIAATLAGLGTFVWMMVQCYLAIQRSRRGECSRAGCPKRLGQ